MIENSIAKLTTHATTVKNSHIRDLFKQDKRRFETFHRNYDGLLLDFSKNLITDETLTLLANWLEARNFTQYRADLFAGKKINHTEDKPALHMALRHFGNKFPAEIMAKVKDSRTKMTDFANKLSKNQLESYGIKIPITDIVNIGIGGSDLGPMMAYEALKPYHQKNVRCHFVSHIDDAHLNDVVGGLNPKQTIFLVASKSFTTFETLENAKSAWQWAQNHLAEDTKNHFFAITARMQPARAFGIKGAHIFELWDFVGGRTSLCSAVGLSVMLAIGPKCFFDMLRGFESMDKHFQSNDLTQNIPALLAMMHLWNRNFLGTTSHAIIPYDYRMRHFPAYLQQLLMESCGKSVMRDGAKSVLKTAPIYWGESGCNAQHSFFQLFHQGTDIIPIDFLLARNSIGGTQKSHLALAASCFAQAESLMVGAESYADDSHDKNSKWRVFDGNRPSNMILYPALTPYYLGMIIALYEHCCFTQSVAWHLNPFDQFGVELGKQKMQTLSELLHHPNNSKSDRDGSTLSLIDDFHHGVKITTEKAR